MRTLLTIVGMYMLHRVLLQLWPAYQAYMQRLDHRLTWVSVILVLYFLINAVLRLFFSIR